MRYLKQTDKFRCGPITIYNVMKWLGESPNFKKIDKLCRADVQNTKLGTETSVFNTSLRKLTKGKGKVLYRKNPSYDDIRKHLNSGGIIAVTYAYESSENEIHRHFFMIDEIYKSYFVVINFYRDLTYSMISKHFLQRDVIQERFGKHHFWFISKNS